MSHEQVTKLLAIGKTDQLEGFVSNRTKRKFKAMLVWDEKEGKVTFEFAPRVAKPGAKTTAGAVAGASAVAAPYVRAAARAPAKNAAAKTTVARKAPAKKAAARKRAV